jgi:hypothetical protein
MMMIKVRYFMPIFNSPKLHRNDFSRLQGNHSKDFKKKLAYSVITM